MEIKPLNDYVIIEPQKEDKKSSSGIVIPETAEDKPVVGKVIAVGPGKLNEKGERIPMSVKVGDKVLFTKYAPNEIKVEGKEYLTIREDEILAIIG